MAKKLVILEYKNGSRNPVAQWYADIVVKRKQGKIVGPAPLESYPEKDKMAAIEAGYVKLPSKDEEEDEPRGSTKK